jgi:hypothetical protein
MIDSGFILVRPNSMANSKAKAEKANREIIINTIHKRPCMSLTERHRGIAQI